jgi:purine-cytosine permease-like protein
MMGIFLTLITDTSDFCRYTKNNPEMFFGTVVGTSVSQFIASFMGVYSALAIKNWNPFEAITHTNPALIVVVFLIIMVVLDNWSVNILNLYTAGLCLVNSVPKLGRFWWTVIAGVFATIASTMPVFIEQASAIVNQFGLVYSPIAGILMADLLFLKKFKMDMNELMKTDGRYGYYKGWNLIAILVIAIGAISFNFWPDIMVPVLSNIIFTGILYYVLVKVISPHWEGLRIASTPYEEEATPSKENPIAG